MSVMSIQYDLQLAICAISIQSVHLLKAAKAGS